MSQSQLTFNIKLGKQKPESMINKSNACPFCDRPNLTDIIEEDGSIILLKNKFPVLEDTEQLVLIESDECDSNITTYSKEHLNRLLQFGIKHWKSMSASGEFESVIFYKNHGPLSGGSIHHPHMQIVGMNKINYLDRVESHHFIGLKIAESHDVSLNISTMPRMGFYEWNIIMPSNGNLEVLANYVQSTCHYILNHFHSSCNSFNLFFYEWDEKIYVKVIPRFVTTPLFIGYLIPQVSNRIEEVVDEMRKLYFE